jgi:hypothetical protein
MGAKEERQSLAEAWAEDVSKRAYLSVPLADLDHMADGYPPSVVRGTLASRKVYLVGEALREGSYDHEQSWVILDWIRTQEPVIASLSRRPVPTALVLGMSTGELERWSRANHVVDIARMNIAGLRSHNYIADYHNYKFNTLDCFDLICSPGTNRALATTVQAVLLQHAKIRGRALSLEKAAEVWRSKPPSEPQLLAGWRALRSRRPVIRPKFWPSSSETKFSYTLQVDPPLVNISGGPWGKRKAVDISLAAWPRGVHSLVGAMLEHEELLINDAVVDLLTDPTLAAPRRELLEIVGMADWEREVAMLERVVGVEPIEPDSVFGWLFETPPFGMRNLDPVAIRFRRDLWIAKSLGGKVVPARLLDNALDEQLLDELVHRERPYVATADLLRLLVGHAHLFYKDLGGIFPLHLRQAEFTLTLEPRGEDFGWVARADGEDVTDRLTAAIGDAKGWNGWWLFVISPAEWAVVRVPNRAARLLSELRTRQNRLPVEALPAVLAQVESARHIMPVGVDRSLAGEKIPGDPRPLLRISGEVGALNVSVWMRPLPDHAAVVPGEGADTLHVLREGAVRHVERLRALEAEHVQEWLASFGLADFGRGWRWELRDPQRALAFVSAVQAAGTHLQVEWSGAPVRVRRPVKAKDLNLRLSTGGNWLRLDASADVDGQTLDLGALRTAVESGDGWVRVADGSWVMLEASVRELLGGLVRLGDGEPEVSAVHAPVLRALEEAGASIDAPARFREAGQRIDEAFGLLTSIPEGLNASLRPYQVEGFRWLASLAHWAPGAVLADDMGLGKTIQTITLLLHRAAEGAALVVAPTSVVDNWAAEIARFAPSLRVSVHRGAGRIDRLGQPAASEVVITSYDLVVRDADALSSRTFGTLVLDEAQLLKNFATLRARAVSTLHAAFRVALSGTPVENHLVDLWSILKGAGLDLLGDLNGFRERFAEPIQARRDATARAALAKLVRPFVLRRRKGEVERDLPARTEAVIAVQLSTDERVLYERERLRAVRMLEERGSDKNQFAVLAALLRLRQLACHPRLVDDTSTLASSKLARVRELLADLRDAGHKVLVFSQFTTHLGLVREALESDGFAIRYLDGSTAPEQRAREVAAFQAGDGDVFLLSLKAGGTGLNLTAATYVLHLDPWWNPAAEDQATDRAHRIGQSRPVTVYRLVSRGTIEERILQLHGVKRELASAVLEGTDTAYRVSSDELRDLLSEVGDTGEDEAEFVEEAPVAPAAVAPEPAAPRAAKKGKGAESSQPAASLEDPAPVGGDASVASEAVEAQPDASAALTPAPVAERGAEGPAEAAQATGEAVAASLEPSAEVAAPAAPAGKREGAPAAAETQAPAAKKEVVAAPASAKGKGKAVAAAPAVSVPSAAPTEPVVTSPAAPAASPPSAAPAVPASAKGKGKAVAAAPAVSVPSAAPAEPVVTSPAASPPSAAPAVPASAKGKGKAVAAAPAVTVPSAAPAEPVVTSPAASPPSSAAPAVPAPAKGKGKAVAAAPAVSVPSAAPAKPVVTSPAASAPSEASAVPAPAKGKGKAVAAAPAVSVPSAAPAEPVVTSPAAPAESAASAPPVIAAAKGKLAAAAAAADSGERVAAPAPATAKGKGKAVVASAAPAAVDSEGDHGVASSAPPAGSAPLASPAAAAEAVPPASPAAKGKGKVVAAPPSASTAPAASAAPAESVAPAAPAKGKAAKAPSAVSTAPAGGDAGAVSADAAVDAAPQTAPEVSEATPAASAPAPMVGSIISYAQALEAWHADGLEQKVVAASSLRSYRTALEVFVQEINGRFVWPEELEDAFDEWVYEAPSLGRSKGRIGHTRAGVRGVATKWRELEGQG